MIEPFKRKTAKELEKLTFARIKAYYRAERKRLGRWIPWCCEYHCERIYDEDKTIEQHKAWEKYIWFVKAIMKQKEADLEFRKAVS